MTQAVEHVRARAERTVRATAKARRRPIARQSYLFAEAVPECTRPIIIDYFAGGGGVSHGIEQALGRSPDVAINHCAQAIAMHRINHPASEHLCVDVFDVDPVLHIPPGRVKFGWLSPSCTHFAHARGSRPVTKQMRGLAWVGLRLAAKRKPDILFYENVREFLTWGPVRRGRPVRSKAGQTFRVFVAQLESLGYAVEWRVLDAADYGAPTHRRRLILIARCDGLPIVWPEPTHGPGRAHPYRTAAECVDWSLPSTSIFDRKRPLADATMRRIAEGLRRFVLENPKPYIVNAGTETQAPTLIQTGYGERKGQTPRALDLHQPLGTIVACGVKHALVSAFLAKHYKGVVGHGVDRPIGTITAKDHHSLVEVQLEPGQDKSDRVAAFITTYYGQSVGQSLREPLATIVTKARFGLVTVDINGETYAVTDIRLRMLSPKELARCQGFDDSYQLIGTQAEQIERIGNSVSPPLVRAIIAANVSRDDVAVAA